MRLDAVGDSRLLGESVHDAWTNTVRTVGEDPQAFGHDLWTDLFLISEALAPEGGPMVPQWWPPWATTSW